MMVLHGRERFKGPKAQGRSGWFQIGLALQRQEARRLPRNLTAQTTHQPLGVLPGPFVAGAGVLPILSNFLRIPADEVGESLRHDHSRKTEKDRENTDIHPRNCHRGTSI
jgi:hypothetical protein